MGLDSSAQEQIRLELVLAEPQLHHQVLGEVQQVVAESLLKILVLVGSHNIYQYKVCRAGII